MSLLFWVLTFLPTFRDSLTLEAGTYRLSRNLGKQQPTNERCVQTGEERRPQELIRLLRCATV